MDKHYEAERAWRERADRANRRVLERMEASATRFMEEHAAATGRVMSILERILDPASNGLL